MGNSLIVAVGATVLACVASILSGFVYSRYTNRFLAGSVLYLIAIRLLPPIVVTLPLFPVVDALKLSDTHLVLIVLYATFWVSLCTMIMKTFIDKIPRTLDEAAVVDGATTMQTLVRVIMPLALQGIAACAIFVFVYSWNEYLFALIFTTQHAKTAPLIISEVMDAVSGTNWGVLFAGVTVQLLPVVLLVMFAQKFLIAGLTAGSVKG
jgi:multiple sugar transport system permease protein